MSNPFQDETGKVHFPLRPHSDRAFIFPSPPPEKFPGEGLIIIPAQYREEYRDSTGILLAIGPGYYDRKGKWYSTHPDLKPGILVYYDHTVPWRHMERDLNGKLQIVVLCGAADIHGIISKK